MTLHSAPSGKPFSDPPMPQQTSDLLLVLIFSLIGLKLLAPLIFSLFLGGDGPASDKPSPNAQVMATATLLIAHSLVILAAVRAFAVRKYGLSWRDLGLDRFENRHLMIGVGAGLLAVPLVSVLVGLMENFLGQPIDNPQLEVLAPIGSSFGAYLFIALIGATIGPLAEELAFRGLFYQWLRQRWGIQFALIASGVFFGVMHGVPAIIPAIAGLGILFAGLFQITRSIWPSVIAHGTFNFIMMTFLYVHLTGQLGVSSTAS